MDLRDFMRKMNDNTTQGKKAYSAPNDIPEDTSEEGLPEGWVDIGPVPPDPACYTLELQQIKKEFALIAIQMITMHPKIIDIPTATDEAVELKRKGEYLKSSRYYADYLRDHELLTPMMAMGWFKTLATGGDTKDALWIADYLLDSNPPECYATTTLRQHKDTLKQLTDSLDKKSVLQYLQFLSGNPYYCMVATDVDVFAETENEESHDDDDTEKSDEYGVAVRHHWASIEELLVHDAAVQEEIAGRYCVLTPADHCYLFTDPMEQYGLFVVAARFQLDEITVHLCIEQNETTGKKASFLVDAYGRMDRMEIDPILKQYIATIKPDLPNWIAPAVQ